MWMKTIKSTQRPGRNPALRSLWRKLYDRAKTFEGYELANVEGPTEGILMRRYQLLFSITKSQ